jgi:hypothetical protein
MFSEGAELRKEARTDLGKDFRGFVSLRLGFPLRHFLRSCVCGCGIFIFLYWHNVVELHARRYPQGSVRGINRRFLDFGLGLRKLRSLFDPLFLYIVRL